MRTGIAYCIRTGCLQRIFPSASLEAKINYFLRSSCILSKFLNKMSALPSSLGASWNSCFAWLVKWAFVSYCVRTGTSNEEASAIICIAVIFHRWLPSFCSGKLSMLQRISLSMIRTCCQLSMSTATISMLRLKINLFLSAASLIRVLMTEQQDFLSSSFYALGVKVSFHWIRRVHRSLKK